MEKAIETLINAEQTDVKIKDCVTRDKHELLNSDINMNFGNLNTNMNCET